MQTFSDETYVLKYLPTIDLHLIIFYARISPTHTARIVGHVTLARIPIRQRQGTASENPRAIATLVVDHSEVGKVKQS